MVAHARKVVVFVIGSTVILIGVVLLFLPGPGMLTIFGGVAVLAAEFAWAKRLLQRMRKGAQGGIDKMKKIVS